MSETWTVFFHLTTIILLVALPTALVLASWHSALGNAVRNVFETIVDVLSNPVVAILGLSITLVMVFSYLFHRLPFGGAPAAP